MSTVCLLLVEEDQNRALYGLSFLYSVTLQAFHVDGHQEGDGHGDDEGGEDQYVIWKGSFVLLGTYLFYLLEKSLHTYGHSHHEEKTVNN